jgi:2-(1,2-epoxy-1,2-dihydrophenyl)acetyl-CoA isomerase
VTPANAEAKTLDEQVLTRTENGVLWITLNRPEVANAVTPDQRNYIIDLLEQANESYDVRCVVITATGKFFCTGADLRTDRGASPAKPDGAPERIVGEARRMMMTGAIRLMSTVMDCDKPVIAAVPGTAAGIGAHLAFACDLVIAADTAKFIEVFVRRGLVCDGLGTWILPRLVGLQKAKELIFFGDDVPAARAHEIGLVNKVVPGDELEAVTKEWAERLAAGPSKSIMFNKWLLNRSLDVDRRTIAEAEAWAVEANVGTGDAAEGVASFVERRPPSFKGW